VINDYVENVAQKKKPKAWKNKQLIRVIYYYQQIIIDKCRMSFKIKKMILKKPSLHIFFIVISSLVNIGKNRKKKWINTKKKGRLLRRGKNIL